MSQPVGILVNKQQYSKAFDIIIRNQETIQVLGTASGSQRGDFIVRKQKRIQAGMCSNSQ